MMKMLYEKNLNSEVTRVIEMNKVKDTPQEHFKNEGIIEGDKIRVHVESEYPRVSQYVNTFLKTIWDININNVDKSNALNHITHTKLKVQKSEGFEESNIFVNTKENKTYVVKVIKNENKYRYEGFIIPTYEDTDKYLRNVLRLQVDNEVPSSRTSNALRKLWLYQIQNELPEQVSETELINPYMSEIVQYLAEYMQSSDELAEAHITYRELFDFFDEVKNQYITEKTQNVQNWVAYSKANYVMQSYEMHECSEHLNQKFGRASIEDFNRIRRMIKKDKRFKHEIKNIYKVNDARPKKQGMARFTGAHGSPNRTVLSILLNGLKSDKSLNKEGISHSYTGSGLGNGVYFTHLHQASKSANYTNEGNDRRFLIIADVDYDENNVKYCKSYGRIETHNYSLIHGVKVGSYQYDEIVAPHDDQINIRFLVEIA